MKNFINCIILSLLFSWHVPAQSDSTSIYTLNSFKIDSILMRGNDITDEDIIYRELTFKLNDTVDYKVLKYNENRIYSLGIFTTVYLIPFYKNGKVILAIDLKESWYIWPLPFAELADKSWDKITYGFDINVKNFRGRNENIRTRFAFGYNPSVSISYSIPLLFRKAEISLRADINYGTMSNISNNAKKLYGGDFDQKYSSASLTLGKRINLFHYFFLLGGFQYVETPKHIHGISVSKDRIDRIYISGLGYSYDSRDLAQFPEQGVYFNTSFQYKGMGINDIDYKIFNIDFREYRVIVGNLSAKWRFYTRQAYGSNIPFFDYSYLGYAERIRGHFKLTAEGNSSVLGSVEVKYPIIKKWDIEFNFPIIPKSLQTYRVAVYAQSFFDAGNVTKQESDLMLKNFVTGYGCGLTFLVLPYNIARLEVGLDKFGNKEWIFDLGISF